MTISSSLNAGVAGLFANATRLATISDNIANSSTFGYKRAATEFESMVITGAAGVYGRGLAEAFAREGAQLLLTDGDAGAHAAGAGINGGLGNNLAAGARQ